MATASESTIRAAAINKDLGDWTRGPYGNRAARVLEWCEKNGITNCMTAPQLQAGMQKMPYWQQGPSDYLDFVGAYNAAQSVKGN